MIKIRFILLFTLTTMVGFGQLDNSQSFLNLNVGVATDSRENDFVNAQGYDVKSIYQNHISYAELAITSVNYDSWENSYFKSGGTITFKYFYPIYSNDSIKTKYSGNLFGFDLIGVNLLPLTSLLDVVIAGGVNLGSKKVRVDKSVRYKNYIFAPRLTSEIRFRFSEKISISARMEKLFDVSKPIWKLKKGQDILQLNELRYSPFLFSAGIGILL